MTFPGIFVLPLVSWPGDKGGARRKPRRAKFPAEGSSGFREKQAGAPFRTKNGTTKPEPVRLWRQRFRPIPGSKPASGFLRAPPLPPGHDTRGSIKIPGNVKLYLTVA